MDGADDPSDAVSKAWLAASRAFGIDVIAPYLMQNGAKTVKFEAFLPDFGGPNGMVLGLVADTDAEMREPLRCANAAGLNVSFLNPEVYGEFNKKEFWDALKDWGYFGSKNRKPKWASST
jgi:hypothetical protein